MCESFSELGEDGNEDYQVCNCLHSFIACLFFQVFDFFAVVITFIVYLVIGNIEGLSPAVFVPMIALIISFAIYPLGPVGLLFQKSLPLAIYNGRLAAIVVYSIAWMGYSLVVQATLGGIVVGVVWFLAATFYLWGLFVTTKAISYLNGHYRGYDDVDPDDAARFERELKEKMAELEQRELDMERDERDESADETAGSKVTSRASTAEKTEKKP